MTTNQPEIIPESLAAEIEALPRCEVEELRLRAFAFAVGERILKDEFGIEVEDEL